MPGKKKEREETTPNKPQTALPTPLRPESLGVLFQTLFLGEKNEIRFSSLWKTGSVPSTG